MDLRALNPQAPALASLLAAADTAKEAPPAPDAALTAGATEAGPLTDLTALARAMGDAFATIGAQAESHHGDAVARDRSTALAERDPTASALANPPGAANTSSQSAQATPTNIWPATTMQPAPAEVASALVHAESPSAAPRETVVQVVPALVAALQADTAQRAGQRVTAQDDPERRPGHLRVERDAQSEGDSAAPQDHDDDFPGDEPDAAEPSRTAEAHDARRMRPSYRELTRALHDAGQHAALQELALGRRILLVAPSPHASLDDTARLVAHLLWTNASGIGQAHAYRARGELPAAKHGDDGWHHWRMHRERGVNDEPRLVMSHTAAPKKAPAARNRSAAPLLSVHMAAAGSSSPSRPIADARSAWLHLLDVQRLVHDMGTQWSVLLVWSAAPVDDVAPAQNSPHSPNAPTAPNAEPGTSNAEIA